MLLRTGTDYNGKKFGEYTIEKPIGEGAFGICFAATSDTGQKVVIKKLKPITRKREASRNDYEADILSSLNDKRIPQFFGYIKEDGLYGLVMEFMNGNTVEKLILKHKHQFSDAEFFNIGIQLISIIKYLHQQGIVHRDIRTPNVLIDNNKVYLIDFGMARWADDKQFPYKIDFFRWGYFLTALLYSSSKIQGNRKRFSQYRQLRLTPEQTVFMKKLFDMKSPYQNIIDIETDFINAFKTSNHPM